MQIKPTPVLSSTHWPHKRKKMWVSPQHTVLWTWVCQEVRVWGVVWLGFREHSLEIRVERSLSTGLWVEADRRWDSHRSVWLGKKSCLIYFEITQIILQGRIKSDLKLRRGSKLLILSKVTFFLVQQLLYLSVVLHT